MKKLYKIKVLIILGISFFIGTGLFAQNDNDSKKKDKDNGRFFIRGGIGAQGGFSVFYPSDLNQFTKDFWNHLVEQYYPWGEGPGDNPVMPIIIGIDWQVKAILRLINVFQLEGYREEFYGMGMKFTSDFYSYGYGVQDQRLSASYKFIPGYSAWGGNLLFTPGAKRKPVFFTVGAGIASYTGTLKYHEEGSSTINGLVSAFNDTRNYKGDVIGYKFIIGSTYVPWKYLELETFLTGRLAKIPELRDEDGFVLVNPYRDNKKISLDFSGIDIRLGIKVILP